MGRQKKVYTERICANPDCGCSFMPTKIWQIYCDPICRINRFSEKRVAKLERLHGMVAIYFGRATMTLNEAILSMNQENTG